MSTSRKPLAFMALAFAASVQAIDVTTTADENGSNPGACALREAVRTINTQSSFGGCTFNAGDSLIELGAGTYRLSLNLGTIDRVQLEQTMTLLGAGPDLTIIERAAPFEDDLFLIGPRAPVGIAAFEGLTRRGPSTGVSANAHCIANTGSELQLRNVAFRDSIGSPALLIQRNGAGAVRLARVVLENNTNTAASGDSGAAIYCESNQGNPTRLTLREVTLRNNVGRGRGAGLYSQACDLDLERVTFESNHAVSDTGDSLGGAMAIADEFANNQVSLRNVTIS